MRVMSKAVLNIVLVAVLLMSGCSDRGSNAGPEYVGNSGILDFDHVFYYEFMVQIKNPLQQSFLKAYVPNVGTWGTPPSYVPDRQLPLLLLLPPQGGDENYYFSHGLAQVANELLTEGLIEPMVIVSIANDATFGGFWWAGNGGGAGDYDTLIGGTLIDHIWARALGTTDPFDTSQGMTGIGGIGEGAYGAFRAAMLHPGRFGSISAIDGPLDFDGADGNHGLIPLFEDALVEEGLLNDPGYAADWDSSGQYPLGRLLIGAALAFSPHDTLVEPIAGYEVSLPDSLRFALSGTDGLVENVVQLDNYNFDFHLPFDSAGTPLTLENENTEEPIWDMWLKNSPDRMCHKYHRDGYDFQNVDMWIVASTQNDPYGYNLMTQSFIQLLRGYGYDPQAKFYSGYPGNPAHGDEYLNYLLREMLIFHSNSFKAAREAQPE